MAQKIYRVGILGATGMVGQRFVTLLSDHPWFEISTIAASPRSAGKPYTDAVKDRWGMDGSIPERIANMKLYSVIDDVDVIADEVDIVFCALAIDKDMIRDIETMYASKNILVVSNNSAHRWTSEVPMIIPEVNPEHSALLTAQRAQHNWHKGGIVVKPNCSIQSYLMIMQALREFKPRMVQVTSIQAVSGAGKTLITWPEMDGNIIPYIDGEEKKSQHEPLKVLGVLDSDRIRAAEDVRINATCLRVPISDGHTASVGISFERKPTYDEIITAINSFNVLNVPFIKNLPSAPDKAIYYFDEQTRPQVLLDRDNGKGMAVSVGRLREGELFDWEFVSLAHNTIRGAAGGAVLTAELLVAQGFVE
jgi:aspartate-semialdehyde dehydrogenase